MHIEPLREQVGGRLVVGLPERRESGVRGQIGAAGPECDHVQPLHSVRKRRCPTVDVTKQVVRLQSGYLYHYAFAMLIGIAALLTWAIASGGLL